MNRDKKVVARISAGELAQELVLNHPEVIDLDRNYSHGPGGAKSFIDEGRTAFNMSWTFTNNAVSTDVVLALGNLTQSIYADAAEAVAALGADYIVSEGTIVTVETDKDITAASNDAGRTIDQFIKYFGKSATRMTKVAMSSTDLSGNEDTSNYTGSLSAYWVSPFQKPIEKVFQLRQLISGGTFKPQFTEIDFLKTGFEVICSEEHFLVFTLKRSTILTLTWEVGMQDSSPQRFHRSVKAVDAKLRPFR